MIQLWLLCCSDVAAGGCLLMTAITRSLCTLDPAELAQHPLPFILVVIFTSFSSLFCLSMFKFLLDYKRSSDLMCRFWEGCHFLIVMLMGWLVIRGQMLLSAPCTLFLFVSLSHIYSFSAVFWHFMSPSSLSFFSPHSFLARGEKDTAKYCFTQW